MYPHSIFKTQPLVRALVALTDLRPALLGTYSIEPSFLGAFDLIEDTLNSPEIDGEHVFHFKVSPKKNPDSVYFWASFAKVEVVH